MTINKSITKKEIVFLFLFAFLIRSLVFLIYVQKEERYCQSDSMDYHIAGACIAHGLGMRRPDTQKPLFWRTPGYPAYLSLFYNLYGLKSFNFSDNSQAQKSSIWLQIFLSSFLPILIFFLGFTITQSYLISIIASWFSVFHLGFVLASTYLLTDALALLFFIIFLLFFYKHFMNGNKKIINYKHIILSSFALAIFTWMRPMGQFIAIFATLLLFLSNVQLNLKFKSALLFIICFFISISPWYIRNYNLTGKIFFCPLFGPYLTVFSAPKIKSTLENIPLIEAHKILSIQGGQQAEKDNIEANLNNSSKVVCSELSCVKVALPIILAHPFLFIKDWFTEVFKTTFDLYSSQLVSFAANRFKWDPLIEYLPTKIAECLWKQKMSIFMRLICWIEFLTNIILWICFFLGLYFFLLIPLFNWSKINLETKNTAFIWLISIIFAAITVCMTGGFGYARLRLPIESLFIILSLQSAILIMSPFLYKILNFVKFSRSRSLIS